MSFSQVKLCTKFSLYRTAVWLAQVSYSTTFKIERFEFTNYYEARISAQDVDAILILATPIAMPDDAFILTLGVTAIGSTNTKAFKRCRDADVK